MSRARKNPPRDFELLKVMTLPAAYSKGADALGRSKSKYERKTASFSVDEFDQIEALAKANASVNPAVKQHKGKSRSYVCLEG